MKLAAFAPILDVEDLCFAHPGQPALEVAPEIRTQR